jgi:hypothetical protein
LRSASDSLLLTTAAMDVSMAIEGTRRRLIGVLRRPQTEEIESRVSLSKGMDTTEEKKIPFFSHHRRPRDQPDHGQKLPALLLPLAGTTGAAQQLTAGRISCCP